MINCNLKRYVKRHYYTRKFYDYMLKLKNIYYYHSGNKISIEKGNKIIKDSSLYLRDSRIIIKGKGNMIKIGSNCNIRGLRVLMYGNNNGLEIGNRIIINASKIQPTVINVIGGKKIIFGNNCLLSNNIEIHTSDYHGIYSLPDGLRSNPDADIIIGNNVWIGLGTMILKGTEIGNDCVIGAKSVVTGHYKYNNMLIVGNPARIIENKKICWTYERKDQL